MRKIILLMALPAIMLPLFMSCSSQELPDAIDQSKSLDVFYADAIGMETKASAEGDYKMHWDEDDQISVFSTTYNQKYTLDYVSSTGRGRFVKSKTSSFVTGNELETNYAIYPYNSKTTITESGCITYTLESSCFYLDTTIIKSGPMVAVGKDSSDDNLEFKSICGYLVIPLYGDTVIKSINFKGNNSEPLTGSINITQSYGQSPSFEYVSSSNVINGSYPDGISLSEDPNECKYISMFIPPVTFEKGFTLTLVDKENYPHVYTTDKARTIERNVINIMQPIEVTAVTGWTEFYGSGAVAGDKGHIYERCWVEEYDTQMFYVETPFTNIRFCKLVDAWQGNKETVDYVFYWDTSTNNLYIPHQWMGYDLSDGSSVYAGTAAEFYNAYYGWGKICPSQEYFDWADSWIPKNGFFQPY